MVTCYSSRWNKIFWNLNAKLFLSFPSWNWVNIPKYQKMHVCNYFKKNIKINIGIPFEFYKYIKNISHMGDAESLKQQKKQKCLVSSGRLFNKKSPVDRKAGFPRWHWHSHHSRTLRVRDWFGPVDRLSVQNWIYSKM